MACPTPISPVWTPSGWSPSSQTPGNNAPIIPPTTVVPSGATLVFIQLSIRSSVAWDAAFPATPTGAPAGNPVRVQVAGTASNQWNDTLAFAPLYSGTFYIKNSAVGHNVDIVVVVLGYA